MILPNKYEMSLEENIFIAKRILVDLVYQQANLEGIGVTFADTQDILNNINVRTLSPAEISKVCCLRDGWEYLLSHIDSPGSTPDQNHMTDHALELGLWLMRCQPFKDGNKRIGSFVINKILIQNGCGIFNIPVKLDGKFKQYLVDFYETNDPDFLKQ